MARRTGFTIVELLVVIAVIGILIALMIPAIEAARESARSAVCLNNLKQLAIATQHFHEAKQVLPVYWWQKNPDPAVPRGAQAEGGWLMFILPELELRGAYADMTADKLMRVRAKRVLAQPASADYQPGKQAVMTPAVYGPKPAPVWIPGATTKQTDSKSPFNGHSYTPENTATTEGRWYQPPTPVITPAKQVSPAVPQVGTEPVYEYVYSYEGLLTHSAMVVPITCCPSDSLSQAGATTIVANPAAPSGAKPNFSLTNYIANFQAFVLSVTAANKPAARPFLQCIPNRIEDIRDGASNTILFGEGMRLCDGTYRMAFWSSYQYRHSHNFGVDWNGVTNTAMFQSISNASKCNNWRLQGMHRGSLNVAMGDGSVRSIPSGIDHRETTDPNNPKSGVDWTMGASDGAWDRLIQPCDGEQVRN